MPVRGMQMHKKHEMLYENHRKSEQLRFSPHEEVLVDTDMFDM
jgi:hypothetical protein